MTPCPTGAQQDNQGSVESPNFPDTYPPNTDCYSVIRVRPGQVVTLKFDTLFLERRPKCSSDFVEVFDGPSIGKCRRHARDNPLSLLQKFVI